MEYTRTRNWLLAAALVTLPAGLACAQELGGAAAEQDAPVAQVAEPGLVSEGFTYSIGMGFESMFVTSGSQAAYATFVPEVALEYYGAYLVLVGFLPLNTNSGNQNTEDRYLNEYDLSAGYALNIEEIVTVSLGATYYMYPDNGSSPSQTRELNFEVVLDVLLSPYVAVNYDFDFEQTEVIVGISYDFSLAELTGFESLSLSTGVSYGYVQADNVEASSEDKEHDGYGYVEAVANIIYQANDTLSLYIGPRFAYNNNGKEMNMNDNETKVWVGMGAAWSF